MSKALLLNAAASGAAGGAVTYVEDVFSTDLWRGNSGTLSVTNGIDFTEGGLVWIKNRGKVENHILTDTTSNGDKFLSSNTTSTHTNFYTGGGSDESFIFSSTGFSSTASDHKWNDSGYDYVGWSFRKQEKFFDIVTYTGNGTAGRTVSHNLGSVPGVILIKNLTSANSWAMYHRSTGASDSTSPQGYYLVLNNNDVRQIATQAEAGNAWNNTAPTSTQFTLGDYTGVNQNGKNYVAYLFGHNEAVYGQNSDEAIIYCDSFTTTSTWGSFRANIGFEPQWILVKRIDESSDWTVLDSMRGVAGPGDQTLVDTLFSNDSNDQELKANSSAVESAQGRGGFYSKGYIGSLGGIGNATYVYMAIRRPNKPASEFTASQVFHQQALSAGEGTDTFVSTGFPVDALIYAKTNANAPKIFGSRLTGGRKLGGELLTDSADAQGTNTGAFFLDHNTGVTVDHAGGHFQLGPSATDTAYVRYFFRRVPGFFDVVTYVSNTTYPNTFAHNLGVVPELVIVKRRDGSANWTIYAAPSGNAKHFYLNSTAAEATSSFWNSTTPTASVVTVGGQDETWGYGGYKYIALLFASAAGISKIGSYSGTGSSQTINCGFSSGPRFVLIKNKNNAGGWLVWDSARGLTANNDPFLRLGSNDGNQNYTGDDVDPHSTGFTVSSNNNAVNKSGRDYLFLAIA